MSRNLRRPPSLGLNKPKPAAGSPKIDKEGLPPVAPSSGSRTRKPARVIDGRIHPGTEELNTRKVTDFYKFHRGEVLGEGISGKVYRAVNRSTGDPVAVKVIHYRSIPDLDEVCREVALARKITEEVAHVGLMPILDAFINRIRRSVYVVMPLAEGGELFDRIVNAPGGLSERYVSEVFRNLVEAVQALHDAGFIHRDLKPENVLLFSRDPEAADVVITDYGLSQCTGFYDPFKTHTIGTSGYKAPEVLKHPPLYTKACDCWALGVVLYILVSGMMPFAGDYLSDTSAHRRANRETIAVRTMHADFQFGDAFAKVSTDCKDLITRLLNPNTDTRFTTRDILQHPWIRKKQPHVRLRGSEDRLRHLMLRRKLRTHVLAALAAARLRHSVHKQVHVVLCAKEAFSKKELALMETAFRRIALSTAEPRAAKAAQSVDHVAADAAPSVAGVDGSTGAGSGAGAGAGAGASAGAGAGSGAGAEGDFGARGTPGLNMDGPGPAGSRDEFVTLSQFEMVMQVLGYGHLPLQRCFRYFDSDKNGCVDYKEFIAGLAKFRGDKASMLEFVFQVYGADEGLEHTVTRQDLDDLLQFVDHDYLEEHHDDAVPSLVAMYERLVAQLARGERVKFAELKAAIAGDSHLVRAFLEPFKPRLVSSETAHLTPSKPNFGLVGTPRGDSLRRLHKGFVTEFADTHPLTPSPPRTKRADRTTPSGAIAPPPPQVPVPGEGRTARTGPTQPPAVPASHGKRQKPSLQIETGDAPASARATPRGDTPVTSRAFSWMRGTAALCLGVMGVPLSLGTAGFGAAVRHERRSSLGQTEAPPQ